MPELCAEYSFYVQISIELKLNAQGVYSTYLLGSRRKRKVFPKLSCDFNFFLSSMCCYLKLYITAFMHPGRWSGIATSVQNLRLSDK
jgi:hypothetical protein